MEADCLGNGCSEKALRVHKVNIRQKCAFVKRKPTTSSFRESITSSLRGVILSLPFGVMCPVVGSLQGILEQVSQKALKKTRRLQHPSHKERLRKWGLFGLGRRNVSGESYQ